MATSLSIVEKVKVSAQPVDAKGAPASVDGGTLTWALSAEGVATLVVAPDTFSAEVVAVAPGTVTLTVSAVSQGKAISVSEDFTVTPAAAVAIQLTVEAPVAQ